MADLLREYIEKLVEREIGHYCRYERLVIKTLKSLGLAGSIRSANCTDSLSPDADIVIGDESYYVEVKQDGRARMGSASMRFSVADQSFSPTGLNIELSEMVAEMLNELPDKSLVKGINRLIRFLRQDAIVPRKVSMGFPLSGFLGSSWAKARQLGLLRPINKKFSSDISVISKHYARKDTHYIQIGGWGFYSLGANPAGLPVPVLDGEVVLEVAANKNGDIDGRVTSTAALRIHCRLQPRSPSPYTLDDPESISAMLSKLDHSDADGVESAYELSRQPVRPGVSSIPHPG